MKLRFTISARHELWAIGDWIARDNAERALTFVVELEERCRALTTMPQAYPLISGHEATGIRRVVHGRYLIFYRINASTIEVLHILHGAQEWESWLGNEPSE